MNKSEAMQIIQAEIDNYRSKPYSELAALIDAEPYVGQIIGSSGTEYQVEIMVYWDNKPGGAVRVIGHVDDGGWRANFPLGTSFIKASDDTFIGE